MITAQVNDKPLHAQRADVYAVLCPEGQVESVAVTELSSFYPVLSKTIATRNFKGSAGSQLVVAGIDGDRPVTIVLVGLGSKKLKAHERLEAARRAVGTVIRTVESVKGTELALEFPDHHWFDVDAFVLAKEIIATIEMGSYHFDQFITDESRRHTKIVSCTLVAPAIEHDRIKVGIEFGLRIGYAVNQARHWCDLPACILTPTRLAEHAERVSKAHNLKIEVFDEPTIIKMGMGGLAAVSRGSAEECRLVIIEYKSEHKNAPTIALVGKGITFDSGGLSIKPAARMDEMKDDMAGAAAVISTMEAIAHLKPAVNVIGIAPISENLPSGTATKPGDIVTFYNGKTAEIKNTDAEGRLILADALAYAVKNYKLDAIINAATLTGSCAYALGPFFCGLMSQHEELSEKILAAARNSGDRAWPLPFHNDYKKAVNSTVADLCNEGNAQYRAGAITAGFFLQNFVDNIPWAHLDIAGTSFNVPDMSYYRPGATGFGVRLFIELLMNWHK